MASRSMLPEEDEAGSLTMEAGGLDLTVSSLIMSLAVARFEDRSSSSRAVGRPKDKMNSTWL